MRAIFMRTCVAFLGAILFHSVWAMPKPPMPEVTTGSVKGSVNIATAVFAGGCFWCMEPPFDKLDGVIATVSGYTGGKEANPTYKQVSAGGTGHFEVLQVTYDVDKVSYEKLLDVFWRNIDPFDYRGQFCDKGSQYLSAVFVANEQEKALAEQSLNKVEEAFRQKSDSTKPAIKVETKILAAQPFYPAEDYHQDYYKKNPLRYKYYRSRCGRDDRLAELWGSAK